MKRSIAAIIVGLVLSVAVYAIFSVIPPLSGWTYTYLIGLTLGGGVGGFIQPRYSLIIGAIIATIDQVSNIVVLWHIVKPVPELHSKFGQTVLDGAGYYALGLLVCLSGAMLGGLLRRQVDATRVDVNLTMTREDAKEIAEYYAKWAETQGYEFWSNKTDSITWSEVHGQVEVQVRIEVLEKCPDQLLIHCEVDGPYHKSAFSIDPGHHIRVYKR